MGLLIASFFSCNSKKPLQAGTNPLAVSDAFVQGEWKRAYSIVYECVDSQNRAIVDTVLYETVYSFYPDSAYLCQDNIVRVRCANIVRSICGELVGQGRNLWHVRNDSVFVRVVDSLSTGLDTVPAGSFRLMPLAHDTLVFQTGIELDTCVRQKAAAP